MEKLKYSINTNVYNFAQKSLVSSQPPIEEFYPILIYALYQLNLVQASSSEIFKNIIIKSFLSKFNPEILATSQIPVTCSVNTKKWSY